MISGILKFKTSNVTKGKLSLLFYLFFYLFFGGQASDNMISYLKCSTAVRNRSASGLQVPFASVPGSDRLWLSMEDPSPPLDTPFWWLGVSKPGCLKALKQSNWSLWAVARSLFQLPFPCLALICVAVTVLSDPSPDSHYSRPKS